VEAENLRLQEEAEHERMARQLVDAELRLLHAQIEPHFLFNSLGAVQQLAEHGAPRAAALTANLIRFLRGSMAQIRADDVSLADDFALAEAYLSVMQTRLGSRLTFSTSLSPALGEYRLPPMMVLTLAENAVKHGIEPALRGGSIELSAQVCDDGVEVVVADGGCGLAEPWSEGVGLANVRQRLQLHYGDQASLTLADRLDGGTVATLRLPNNAAGRAISHQSN
jgi:LytS/YehU family sensor histidine kinase